jgi:uncharacterized protein YdeI (YjbR/CyaY-like superfamily)
MAEQVKKFEALLEKGDRALGWTIARVPFDPHAAWKQMIRLRVAGEINGFAFRTSLFADDGFYLLVNHAMQRGARAAVGHRATFALWPDLEERPAELPDELAVLLDEEPGLRDFYDQLSEYTRREIGKWIAGVKNPEAQAGRAMQMAERLLATMEAEQQLPPLIRSALQRRPGAMAGWERMTATQRRGELMAIFYYQTPEARQKRVEKLCDLAAKRAEK